MQKFVSEWLKSLLTSAPRIHPFKLIVEEVQELVDSDFLYQASLRCWDSVALIEVNGIWIIAIPGNNRLGQFEIHPPKPHAGLSPLKRRVAEQRLATLGDFVEIFAYRSDFSHNEAIDIQGWHFTSRVNVSAAALKNE
ncbi:hypothetical protein HG530_012642 [Fusarium avenaceum]|nr:hypothetical protein HG530_012642 [Fusarium avenaceum]